MRDIDRGFSALVAALTTRASSHALTTTLIVQRDDCVAIRPPMPALRVQGSRNLDCAGSKRKWRQRWIRALGVCWISSEPRHPDLAIDLFIVALQLVIADGPVIRDAKPTFRRVVRRQQAG